MKNQRENRWKSGILQIHRPKMIYCSYLTQDTIIMHEQPSYEPTIIDVSYYYCDECDIESDDESP
jgi:hypothetical protein